MLTRMISLMGQEGGKISGLIVSSFKLLGRDKDVGVPLIGMFILKLIRIIAIFSVFYFFFISKAIYLGVMALLFSMLYIPLERFFYMRYKAIASWMVYDILRGEDTYMSKAKKEIKGRGWSLLLYSIIDIFVTSASSKRSRKDGIVSMFMAMIVGIIKEVWDLVKNFSLPILVIEKASLKELPAKLKSLKDNIPSALVGVIGLDVAGSIIASAITLLIMPSLAIGGALGYYAVDFLPKVWTFEIAIPQKPVYMFNALPIFLLLLIVSPIVALMNSLVQLVKSSYFTTMYVAIYRPDEVEPSLRAQLINFINYNDRTGDYDFFDELEQESEIDPRSQKIVAMAELINKNLQKGYSEKSIAKALMKKGKPYQDVKEALLVSREQFD